jgi:hypothetical protein
MGAVNIIAGEGPAPSAGSGLPLKSVASRALGLSLMMVAGALDAGMAEKAITPNTRNATADKRLMFSTAKLYVTEPLHFEISLPLNNRRFNKEPTLYCSEAA